MRFSPPLVVVAFLVMACARPTSATPRGQDAARIRPLSVRVPAGLRVARALDSLSVAIDPASLALTEVEADPGMILGIETVTFVFPEGQRRPDVGRQGFGSGADFDLGAATWNTKEDGVPQLGTKYVAEMRLVLFETDVPPGHMWNPHAGHYMELWTRTLRQPEE